MHHLVIAVVTASVVGGYSIRLHGHQRAEQRRLELWVEHYERTERRGCYQMPDISLNDLLNADVAYLTTLVTPPLRVPPGPVAVGRRARCWYRSANGVNRLHGEPRRIRQPKPPS